MAVASICIGYHLLAVFLNAFPWSPFIAKLYPFYRGYVDFTGQAQVWTMYKSPLHYDPKYEIVATDTSGQLIRPFGYMEDWSPRKLYFVEALFGSNEEFALAFIKHIGSQQRLSTGAVSGLGWKEIRLQMWKAPAPAHGEKRMRLSLDYVLEKEFRVSL